MEINILRNDLRFPEGPVVCDDGNIYCVELQGESITHYDRITKKIRRFNVGGNPNGMMVKDDTTLIFCDAGNNAIRTLDLQTNMTTTLADSVNGESFRAPNDLIMDKHGNILFTCPGGSDKKPIGYICCLDINGTVSVSADSMYFPNGLLFINNERNIIINESWGHQLLIGDWDPEKKKISNIRTFFKIGGIAEPDGLALSEEGLIYAAVYHTGKVWVFDLHGKLIKQIDLPGKCPTNLCFDKYGDLGLLVTEAEMGLLLSEKE